MTQILQREKVSLKSKIREVVRTLLNRTFLNSLMSFQQKQSQGLKL